LLLWCKQDAVIDASALDLYAARMPQAGKVLLDGCGHMSITEQPHNVVVAIESLIEHGVAR
jgi:pimeloyl-ACP methyl ester carboxylesterase